MAHLIELGSGTAAHRAFFFRLFTSNGTSPDTGASNDSVIVARNSNTTFVPDVLVVAVHAAQGMYSVQLTQSNVSNLGQHAIYHTQGDFPQHVASFNVVNFNPYSSQSNQSNQTVGALTSTATGQIVGNLPTLTNLNSGVTVASIAANAMNASALAADAGTEIATAVWAATQSQVAGIPAANAGYGDKVDWLFTKNRNKIVQTSSTLSIRNDADSGTIAGATVADDGTTFTRGEFA